MLTIPAITGLVELEGAAGQYKIFWEDVPDKIGAPYIVLTHLAGGFDNDTQSQASNSLWKVSGFTANKATALALANAISQLHRMMPIHTTYPDAPPYHWLEERLPIFENKSVENTKTYTVGGFYQIKLSHN
ncbi:MAG TPA: hypothetical protein ENI05_14395 [Porticoccus sp.]|nr:hypothetical protein [Porticoccus sp.]